MEIKELKELAKQHVSSILQSYAPTGKWNGSEYEFLNPARDDKSLGNCKFNVNRMNFKDFASDDGGDIIDFIKLHTNGDNASAINELSKFLGQDNLPVEKRKESTSYATALGEPALYKADNFYNGRLKMNPSKIWEHRNIKNQLLGYICRFIKDDGKKDDLPYYWGVRNSDLAEMFVWGAPPSPRPLLGLETLSISSKTVFIVEGQKCQEALQKFIKIPVVTWILGTSNLDKSNWGELIENIGDRNIIYWPDNDEPGLKTIPLLQEILGLEELTYIDSSSKPKGWDCADFIIDEKCTGKELSKFVKDNKTVFTPPKEELQHTETIENLEFDGTMEVSEKDQPFKFLGFNEGKYYYFPDETEQICNFSPTSHSQSNLLSLAPLCYWEACFPGKTSVDWLRAQDELFRKQEAVGMFKNEFVRGLGVWKDEDRVVVHAGSHLIVNKKPIKIHKFKTKYIYERTQSVNINLSKTSPVEESKELLELIKMLKWNKDCSSLFLAGWIAIAPICGSLAWRPHIWLTGAAGSGKTWIKEQIVQYLMGRAAINTLGESTQAGIRQRTQNDSLPVLVDEFEANDVRGADRTKGVIELARQSSSESEATILKGTLSSKSVSFSPRNLFFFSSIGVSIKEVADVTRIAVVKLDRNPDQELFRRIEKKAFTLIDEDFKDRLISRTINLLPVILENMKVFNKIVTKKCGNKKRFGDQYGTLIAGAYSLVSDNVVTESEANDFIDFIDWDDLQVLSDDSEEQRCLQIILESKIRIKTEEFTVAELANDVFKCCDEIADWSTSDFTNESHNDTVNKALISKKALERHGIKVNVDSSWRSSGKYEKFLFISNTNKEIRRMLRETSYENNWANILERAPESEKNLQSFAGTTSRCVRVKF